VTTPNSSPQFGRRALAAAALKPSVAVISLYAICESDEEE
jgi:hypothetical protein